MAITTKTAETVANTVIVSPDEAWGYVYATLRLGTAGTRVCVVAPATEEEAIAAEALHVRDLALAHGGEADAAFLQEAAAGVRGAFASPEDPAVLVRVVTAAGEIGLQQAESIAQAASVATSLN